jgi:hypothetical protein
LRLTVSIPRSFDQFDCCFGSFLLLALADGGGGFQDDAKGASRRSSFVVGLGKTLQTISLIGHLKERNGADAGCSLFVCPLMVLNGAQFLVRRSAQVGTHSQIFNVSFVRCRTRRRRQ